MPPGRKQAKGSSGRESSRAVRPSAGKRKRPDGFTLDWGNADAEASGSGSDEDEPRGVQGMHGGEDHENEAESSETAEEKRLRLARDFLQQMDAEGDEEEEDEKQECEGQVPVGRAERIGERLVRARLEATGQLYREPAKALEGLELDPASVQAWRGFKLSPTCVALSPDDTIAYTGSKDNSVMQWDVETGKKTMLVPRWKKQPGKAPKQTAFCKEVLAVAVSDDGRYLATGGRDKLVRVWDCRTGTSVQSFTGHRDAVSALAFRANSLSLFSGSHDRCVKHWDLNEMGYVETLFGHQAEVNAIDSFQKERVVTAGRDRTVRLWKVLEDTHLVFRSNVGGNLDCISMLNDDWCVSGGEDGQLSVWFAMKKKPAATAAAAHGHSGQGVVRWISSLCCMKQSDLVVSGSNDGFVRMWRADTEARSLTQVTSVPVTGFVNGLAVSSSARFLAAAVGQEHRLGRWERNLKARNTLCIIPLQGNEPGNRSTSEDEEDSSSEDEEDDT